MANHPAGGDQRGLGAGEEDPAWAPEHLAPVVGGGSGGDLCQMVDDFSPVDPWLQVPNCVLIQVAPDGLLTRAAVLRKSNPTCSG